ncbi:hypothetical protein ACQEVC_12780 [Plantactinospora sp. CA-294935]|uniref:hypothetical protein n=1 Tax=Plantactinospora sp. CA-294935 TaxID=3240012 RepID=UPI003D89DD2E
MALLRRSSGATFRGRTREAEAAAAEAVGVARRLHTSTGGHGLLYARALARHAACRYDLGAYELALTDITEAIGRFERCDPTTSPQSRVGLAGARVVLALVLEQLGRDGEALCAAQAGVADWRHHLPGKPVEYRAGLAHALNCLAGRLSVLGRHEEAVAAGLEAVDLYQKLPFSTRARRSVEITNARIRLADELWLIARYEEAIEVLEGASSWAEAAAWLHPATYRPTLAWMRHVEALVAAGLGSHSRAADAAQAAVTLYRWLADQDEATHEPHLAAALRCWADACAAAGHPEDAVTALEEVTAIRVRLARTEADGQAVALAGDLAAWSDGLWALGQRGQASTVARRAVDAYRRIVEKEPSYESTLVSALTTSAARSRAVDRLEDALADAREAATVARRLADDDPGTFAVLLANSLDFLATILSGADQGPEAVDIAEECVAIRRRLAEAQPAVYRADLGNGLTHLGNRLIETDLDGEAIAAYREAAAIHRDNVTDPKHRAALALALANLAVPLAAERLDEPLGHLDEAIAIRTLLVDEDADANREGLAIALRRRGTYLADAGRDDEAMPDLYTATDIYRALAAVDPAAHGEDLALCLGVVALQHARLGRHREAAETLHQLRDLVEQDGTPPLRELYLEAVAEAREEGPSVLEDVMTPSPDQAAAVNKQQIEDAGQVSTESSPVIMVDAATAERLGWQTRAAAASARRAFERTVETLSVRHLVGGGVAGRIDLAAQYLAECAELLTAPRHGQLAAVKAAEMSGVAVALAFAVHRRWEPVATALVLIVGYACGQLLATALRTGLERLDQSRAASIDNPGADADQRLAPAGTIASLKADVQRARAELAAARTHLAPVTQALPTQSSTIAIRRRQQRRQARAARLAHDAEALLIHADSRLDEYVSRL